MNAREEAIREIKRAPEDIVLEVLDFLRYLTSSARSERFDAAVASEPVLRREWDTPEEDEAWANL